MGEITLRRETAEIAVRALMFAAAESDSKTYREQAEYFRQAYREIEAGSVRDEDEDNEREECATDCTEHDNRWAIVTVYWNEGFYTMHYKAVLHAEDVDLLVIAGKKVDIKETFFNHDLALRRYKELYERYEI